MLPARSTATPGVRKYQAWIARWRPGSWKAIRSRYGLPPVRRSTPPRGRGCEAGGGARLCRESRARVWPVRGVRREARRNAKVRGNRMPSGRPDRLLGRRTAPGRRVDSRPGGGRRARPGRARHGMRRARAPLQRLRTVVRGHRDCGAGGDASTRRAIRQRGQSRSARHDDALRRTPEQTGSCEVGRRRSRRRPDPPTYTSRGAHVEGPILDEGFSST